MTDFQKAVSQAVGALSVLPSSPTDAEKTKQVLLTWAAVLAEFQPETVTRAAISLLKSSRFFPVPADMFGKCQELEPRKPMTVKVVPELPMPRAVPLSERADKEQIMAMREKVEGIFERKAVDRRREDPERKKREMRRQIDQAGEV